ncbi:N-alpha-acetyltransferase 40-like [Lineus longissimus]|uniref:N-alpha-acetyltransferase 40-like n=1 Tax=Lineus longissimus TaxID=88925 RepID=UPI002B4D60BD
MGRKSEKAKEKKRLWKEENAKIKASLLIVEAANKLEDPMEKLLPFKKFDRNGLQVTIDCKKGPDVSVEIMDWAFELTKKNMQSLYEESEWGWKDREKREEMEEEKAWYLLACDGTAKTVAFVHFRFDMECDDEVLYCYEIQLEPTVRRKGLGKFLMQILELMAHKTQMKKVMLTAFTHNADAEMFFKKKLKYEVDEITPEDHPMFGEGYTYEILSKTMAQPKKVAAPPANQANGHTACCGGHHVNGHS